MAHGRGSRARNKQRRLEEKRKRKQANKAKYEAWKKEGTNRKVKHSGRKAKSLIISTKDHPDGYCGNVACMKCHKHLPNAIIPIR